MNRRLETASWVVVGLVAALLLMRFGCQWHGPPGAPPPGSPPLPAGQHPPRPPPHPMPPPVPPPGHGAAAGGMAPSDHRAPPDLRDDVEILENEASVRGPLDRVAVMDRARQARGDLMGCYDREVQRYPTLAGRLVVQFSIGPDGDVREAGVLQSTVVDDPLAACVIGNVRSWRFPPPADRGTVLVLLPIAFNRVVMPPPHPPMR
jgi:outer membrane biosynthesis protein TonB